LPAAEALAIKMEGVRMKGARTVRLRLLSTPGQEKALEELADACASMWNEITYGPRHLYFQGRLSRKRVEEIWKRRYKKHRDILGVKAGQVANMSMEAWNSLFGLLRAKKKGRLPPFIKRVSPQGYWKDRELGKRVKRTVIRNDRYHLEPVNAGKGYLVLKDFSTRIEHAGRIKRSGGQDRLAIVKEAERRFAYIPIEVGSKPPKSNPRGYIEGGLDRVKQREPRGDEVASMGMGLNNLFAIVTATGDAALIKGGAVKVEHSWEKAEVGAMQTTRDLLNNKGLEIWKRFHDRYLRAYFKWHERLRHLYRTVNRFTARWLYVRGVKRVYIGYPYMITQDNGNEYNTNTWWFRKVARWLYEVLQEYGVELYLVLEYGTSKECSICHIEHNGARMHRGLYICEKTGKNLNAAVNIAYRVGYEVVIRKIESYRVTHNGVKPVTPCKRGAARDPQ